MSCFFRHKWEVIETGIAKIHFYSGWPYCFDWNENVQMVVLKCSKCGKEKAYYEKSDRSKTKIAVWKAKQYASPV